ncbi:MAG: carboxylesterase [Burkholderiales bacterium]|nr:carboxylesterase [Burkholderiales bacterium]
MLSYRAPLEVETGTPPDASVIWLHGLGANGFDFLPIVDELALAHLPPTRFIFPHAAEQPVTLNGGYVMPSWYDIIGLHADALEDEAGIRASMAYLNRLIERELQRGIASQRIVLAGFSQGGNIALNGALRYPQPLAGALILSSYLGLKDCLAAEASAANRALPIFMAHGTADDIVPYVLADGSRAILTQLGYRVEWHEYAMPHTVCAQEVGDIGNWLAKALAV